MSDYDSLIQGQLEAFGGLDQELLASEKAKLDFKNSLQPVNRELNCPVHGLTTETGFRNHWSGCIECATARADADDKAHKLQERREFLARSCNLPRMYRSVNFADCALTDTRQATVIDRLSQFADELVAGSKKSLILSGPTGTGKTHLAACIANRVIIPTDAKSGLRTKFITSADYLAEIRASWDAKTRTRFESEIRDGLASFDLLLIDEVGVNDRMTNAADLWSALIDQRYREQRPTIITTNLPKDELRAYMGDRAFDRLAQDCLWVSCNWRSHRVVTGNFEEL